MVEFVRLNGTAVRVSSFAERAVREERALRREVAMVVVLRGASAHHAFLGLLAAEPVRVEIPDGPAFAATVVRHEHAAVGPGEGAAYRHELVLRESPTDGSVPPGAA